MTDSHLAPKPATIILVDDHSIYRMGIRSVFGKMKCRCNVTVMAEAGSGKEFFRLLQEGHIPDLVLLDIVLPDLSGVEIARALRNEYPGIKIIMLSTEVSEKLVTELLDISIDGYLSKMARKEDIEKAICAVLAGNLYFGQSVAKIMHDIYLSKRYSDAASKKYTLADNAGHSTAEPLLTKREVDIIRLLSDGLTVREIAEHLFISIRTVETHKANIISKLGFKNTVELIRYAIKNGIVEL